VSLFAELKRRNVIRMAVMYLVCAWVLVQVAETVLPIFQTPGWVLQALVVLVALGLVPALVFSWIYELTPEGLKRDAEVTPTQSSVSTTGRRMDRLILVGLMAVIALVAADRFWLRGDAAPAAGVSGTSVGMASEAGLVAVLPFRNRSVHEEDAFFAEGIHDDLLTQLSRVASLRVISRTSMMRYTGSDKSIPEIARELGAAVVLEGAVQRAGDQVRITVQLIDGATDLHLWSESYDRELSTETIFAIQADIARVITGAMQVALTPAEAGSIAAGSTRNVEAYDAFLQGTLLARFDRLTAERLQQAIAQFDRAIAVDPQFADAWARKARAQLSGAWYALGAPAMREDAARSLEQARRLAPESTETWLAEAVYHYWGRLDYARAEAALARILERSPEHVEAWRARAFVAKRDGRFADALAAYRRALEIDPVNTEFLVDFAHTLNGRGEFTQADSLLERARRLGADTRGHTIFLWLIRGDPEAAWAAVDGPHEGWALDFPFRAALVSRDPERIALALSPSLWPEAQRSPAGFPEAWTLANAEGQLVLGRTEQARAELRAIQARLQALDDPYPGGWHHHAPYWPSALPGLLGDLDGVRAAEQDYLENSPRDVWGGIEVRFDLAIAFARAGDPQRALDHLEAIVAITGPASYLHFSIHPGLDSLHGQPRWIALQGSYERWAGR
jgi:TolB-like protein/cytochrome c-type biogenesis protein CcmH/NrfG